MVGFMIELTERVLNGPNPDGTPLDPRDGASAFLAAAGLVITTVRPDRFEGYIELGDAHHQPWGIVHGGVYATAVESAASLGASAFAAERGQYAVGVNNNTSFLRPLTAGRVDVTAWPIQQGRTQQLWQVEIVDQAGRLIATGQLRVANVDLPTPA
jgi:1,4-dihydroxy-2-naphthoyl-CoA hydrolase